MLELHIIELGKVFSPEDSLADWVKIFNATTEEDLDMIKSNNIGIQTGIKTMRDLRRSTTDSEFQKELIKEYNLK